MIAPHSIVQLNSEHYILLEYRPYQKIGTHEVVMLAVLAPINITKEVLVKPELLREVA